MYQQPQQPNASAQHGGTVYLTGPGGQMYPAPTVNVPQMYVTVPQMQQNFVQSYKSCQSVFLGVALMITGALALIFNVVAMISGDNIASIGHGIWCGLMFIITGCVGIAARKKNRCMIITFMVLCIISSVFTIVLLGFGIPQATDNSRCCEYCYTRCNAVASAMGALLAVLSFIAAVTSIWGSAISCCAVCCCQSSTNPGVVQAQYSQQQVMLISPPGTQQGVQYAPVQLVMSPTQPVYGPSGYYQPPVPQQQPFIQQPMQPAMPGASHGNIIPCAPPADGLDADLSPPAYSAIAHEKPYRP